jgi:hypothetical protein
MPSGDRCSVSAIPRFLLLSAMLQMQAAASQLRLVNRAGQGLDPAVARALHDLGLSFILAWLPLAVLMGVIASRASAASSSPRWIGWTAATLAVALTAGFVLVMIDGPAVALGCFAILLSWLWSSPRASASSGAPAYAPRCHPGRPYRQQAREDAMAGEGSSLADRVSEGRTRRRGWSRTISGTAESAGWVRPA